MLRLRIRSDRFKNETAVEKGDTVSEIKRTEARVDDKTYQHIDVNTLLMLFEVVWKFIEKRREIFRVFEYI
jgi:hypothetical protein